MAQRPSDFVFCILCYHLHLTMSSSQWLKSARRDIKVLYCWYKSQSTLWLFCMAQYAEGNKFIFHNQVQYSGLHLYVFCICNNANTSKSVTIFEQYLQKALFSHAFNCLSIFKFALKLEVKQGQQELEDKLCTIILLDDGFGGVSGGFFGVAVK